MSMSIIMTTVNSTTDSIPTNWSDEKLTCEVSMLLGKELTLEQILCSSKWNDHYSSHKYDCSRQLLQVIDDDPSIDSQLRARYIEAVIQIFHREKYGHDEPMTFDHYEEHVSHVGRILSMIKTRSW